MGRLADRVALISGSARGQGAAEAQRFAEEGAFVVVSDVLDDEGASVAAGLGDAGSYVHLDVTAGADWIAAVAYAEERYGHLDILVNNAGIGIPPHGLLTKRPAPPVRSVRGGERLGLGHLQPAPVTGQPTRATLAAQELQPRLGVDVALADEQLSGVAIFGHLDGGG